MLLGGGHNRHIYKSYPIKRSCAYFVTKSVALRPCRYGPVLFGVLHSFTKVACP